MYRYLLLVLLIVSAHQDGSSENSYFLSPALPPTAFVGQYYTTQFRVLGLDNPIFKFDNLPGCFKGHVDGTLEGTPDKAGSYSVTVHYSTSSVSDSKTNVVVRVAGSVASTQGLNTAAGVLADNQFIVVNPSSSFVYKAGASINLALKATNGKAPLTWSYVNLPAGLSGDKTGKISGAVSQNGYYSFNAVCSDATGQSSDAYYTFNVQPQTITSTSNLIDVSAQNVPLQYDLAQVEKQTIQAENAVYAAIKVVNTEQTEVSNKRAAQAKTTLALQFATTQDNSAVKKVNQAATAVAAAQLASSKAQLILTAANQVVALATTNVNNNVKAVNDAQEAVAAAQDNFNSATQAVKEANNAFINAQAQSSQAAQNAKAAITAALNAENVYNLAFNAYSAAKQALSTAQNQLQQANTVVDAARNALNLANQVNDNAQAQLTAAQNAYNKANSALINANSLVSTISAQRDQAETDLGTAEFNLQQANNNLFVAQARKAQADKATAIVQAQESALPAPGSNSTYIFSGCNQQAYPSVCGTDVVQRANALGYTLNSGNTLLYGSCTSGNAKYNVGDVINYVGYLKNGYYHATSIQQFKQ